MYYTISNDNLSVTVNSFGAELTSVKFCGEEKIWQNDNGEWEDHAPVLFPFCGHFNVVVNGREYPMLPHGFANKCGFALIYQAKDELRFSISQSQYTKKYFPFCFNFDVIYKIDGDTLFITYEILNTEDNPLYFACGGHEPCNFKGELEDYYIEFEKEERLLMLGNDDDGYLDKNDVRLDKSKVLRFSEYPLDGILTLIFKGIKSRKLWLKENGGKSLCEVSFKDFSNILFWRPLNGKTVCIEPWSNLPDVCGEKDMTELKDKKGVFCVKGGKKKIITRSIKYFK